MLLAFSLRPLVTGLGPVLDEVRADLGLSGFVAGAVTTLPVLCFAVFGATAPRVAARLGTHRLAFVAMLTTTAGLVVRVVTGSMVVFVTASTVALAGVAVANVLAPALVRQHFPERVGVVTGVYTMVLQLGAAVGSGISVPLARGPGGWRASLGAWSLASLLAALPWLGLLRGGRVLRRGTTGVSARALLRSRMAWILALFFGVQSAHAYAIFGWLPAILRGAGVSPEAAGLDLAVVTAVGVPVAIALPVLSSRLPTFAPLVAVVSVCYAVAYVGLLVLPATVPWLWALLLGIGGGAFPLALVLIGLRARTGQGTSALSGFAQSIGYLVAAAGPFLVGALHDLTGGWTAPLLVLLGSTAVIALLGLGVARARYVEDELG